MDTLTIKELNLSQAGILKSLLYTAIFVPPGQEKLQFDIITNPEIAVYIKDFGRKGDLCLVAEINGEIAGAVWTRLFNEIEKGFGFISSDIPELSMAVFESFQKKGIGKMLLNGMIKLLIDHGYKNVSLSVDKNNYAYNLYKSYGFEDYESNNDSVTMIKRLK